MKRNRQQQQQQNEPQNPMDMMMGLMGLLMQMQQHEGSMQDREFASEDRDFERRKREFEEPRWPEMAEANKTQMMLQFMNSVLGHRVDTGLANEQFERQGLGALIGQGGSDLPQFANPTMNTDALSEIKSQNFKQYFK